MLIEVGDKKGRTMWFNLLSVVYFTYDKEKDMTILRTTDGGAFEFPGDHAGSIKEYWDKTW